MLLPTVAGSKGERPHLRSNLQIFELSRATPALLGFVAATLAACATPPTDPQQAQIERGRQIFFNETFSGNGRTCGTCHREEANFSIDPAFIATLPPNDPLFVAEFVPALRENFENPRLMREFGLILENLDGFDDLANKFVMRGVPHTLALRTSVASPQGPRTGWSGDGAPGDGSLRAFATGAVIQHFTRTLNRVAGVDFRLPTDEELDALEAFQLSLGRQQELALPLPLKGTVARRGQEIFLDNSLGKCNRCHSNAGANANFGAGSLGNGNFNTGVEGLPDQPARLTGEKVPRDDGLGTPGDGTFNTPPLVEAADTGRFFHNNAIETIEGAVAFYDGAAFNNSPAGRAVGGIELDGTQIVAIAAFLRVINAVENIRASRTNLEAAGRLGSFDSSGRATLVNRALIDIGDAIDGLDGGGLHPDAVADLRKASAAGKKARDSFFGAGHKLQRAIEALDAARARLVDVPGTSPAKATRG
jgi:mono/diheme cytochrome c family protein